MIVEVPPIIAATLEGNSRKVADLLDSGADVNVHGPYGATALHWAAILGHESIAQLLRERGADVSQVDFFFSSPADLARMYENHRVELVLRSRNADTQRRR